MTSRLRRLWCGAAALLVLHGLGSKAAFATDAGGLRLVKAAESGNLAEVRALLASGVDVNSRAKYDATPLLIAAQENHLDVVLALIGAHADLQARTSDLGVMPLDAAADRGHDAIVRALLAADADIDAAENDGTTALGRAAQAGHDDVVRTLVGAHARLEPRNAMGATPLFVAIGDGHLDVVKTLLAAGADANARERDRGATALVLAAQSGETEIARALIRAHADVNATMLGKPAMTALDVALANHHADVASFLITAGARVAGIDAKRAAASSPRDVCAALKTAAATKAALEATGIAGMFTDISDVKARVRLQHLTAVASSSIYFAAAASACTDAADPAARNLAASRDARTREVKQSFGGDTRNACIAAIAPVGTAFGAIERKHDPGASYVVDGGVALIALARPACVGFYRQDLEMAELMAKSLKAASAAAITSRNR